MRKFKFLQNYKTCSNLLIFSKLYVIYIYAYTYLLINKLRFSNFSQAFSIVMSLQGRLQRSCAYCRAAFCVFVEIHRFKELKYM